ncbi:MAG: alpha/beta hydrolase [Spirochaetales bacterium]|nr:alpha/beta hydrolase [Spirochaetales bacterium]
MVTESVFRTDKGRMAVQNRCSRILEFWPVPNERRMVETSRGATHVIISGDESQPPLLLLHGTSSNSASWIGDVETWSRHFRVIAADMPGEPGLSCDLRLSPSGSDYVKWLESLLDVLGIDNISIVGMSLGAFVALKLATDRPGRVIKLSMLTTSGVTPMKISYLFKALPLMILGKWGARRNYGMISHGLPMAEEVFEFGRLVSKHCKPLLEPIPLFSDQELGRLTMPVQYFGGDKDALFDSKAAAKRVRELVPHAEINLLEGTGHVIIGKADEILTFLLK